MQNFTTKPFMALVLRKGISLAPNVARINAADYEALLDIEAAKEAARQEIARIMQEAREEGLRLGREDASKELLDNVAQMKANMDSWVEDTDQKLVEIVGACVSEVVQKVDCADMIRESVEKGLKNLQNAQVVSVRVNPQYLEQARQILLELAPKLDTRVIADASFNDSDCRVESPVGNVDLRLSTRLQNVKKALGL